MNRKILKVATIVLLLVTLTMANFISVGIGLVSYAVSNDATNHQNVEFKATQKQEGTLLLEVGVKKEGYFNGTIQLENSNFNLKKSDSPYVNKIEGNTLTLNQINAGTTAQIEVEIEPVKKDIFDVGLLNMISELILNGIYRDHTEKNIKIQATREVKVEYQEQNTEGSINHSAEIITNKVVEISGEEKRVVQISVNLGLKENNYPIKEIALKVTAPKVNHQSPEVAKNVTFNTMTHYDYQYDGTTAQIVFTNVPNDKNLISWKKQGNENVVLTFIYEKEADIKEAEIQTEQKVTLYNDKVLSTAQTIKVEEQEKDAMIQIKANNIENSIYKGKLYASLDREIQGKTSLKVNLANVHQSVTIAEEQVKYQVGENQVDANVIYKQTTFSKEQFTKLFGENGNITIKNENGEVLATISEQTPIDDNNNFVIDYEGKEPHAIEIEATAPIAEGTLEFIHNKVIKAQEKQTIQSATEFVTKINYAGQTNEARTQLAESKSEIKLETNKQTLSTVTTNNVEIRGTLKANSEQYNLYKNPSITFELPEEVENVQMNGIALIYENELKIRDYAINGRTITVNLEGEQSNYKEKGMEGATIVLDLNITVNKKATTKTSQIIMNCANQGETAAAQKEIRTVAPKDVTLIHNMKELNVETMGQEKVKAVALQRGTDSKTIETQIEMINNNENAVENVKILGTFPTKNGENNIDTKIVEAIRMQMPEGSKIYYTQNEKATEDSKDAKNQWEESVRDAAQVKKFLIEIPKMESQESVQGTYKLEVPAGLDYNQTAKAAYEVSYTNTATKVNNQMKATTLQLETGVGPRAEIKVVPTVGGKQDTVVRNGEVIQYRLEVTNTGSEDIHDLVIAATVPEGTKLVKPEKYYEYTGASYYEELEDKVYHDKIETLPTGKTITKTYEVMVNRDCSEGTKINSVAQIQYGDVKKQSNQTELTSKPGDIRTIVKRITGQNSELYSHGTAIYYAMVENLSDEKQDNVIVRTNLPKEFTVDKLELVTGMEKEEVSDESVHAPGDEDREQIPEETEVDSEESNTQTEEIKYSEAINIGTLNPREVKVLIYKITIKSLENNNVQKLDFSVVTQKGEDEYRSNNLVETVNGIHVAFSMRANTESKYLKSGDVVEYTMTITNQGTADLYDLIIKDNIPEQMTVTKVLVNEEEQQELGNDMELSMDVEAGATKIVKVQAVVDYSEVRNEAEAISNVATAEIDGEEVARTAEISHIIEANETEESNNPNTPEDPDHQGEIANGKQMISGIAWYDENANGRRDQNEKVLENIKVKLLNVKTNRFVKEESGRELEATTNSSGLYVLNNIAKGNYIVVFEYDNTQYTLTKYQAEGVTTDLNSKAMKNELLIEDQRREVASTDMIEISDNNISDINIGFVKLQNFDLKLEKFVSKIIIQNANGTTVKEYNDETMAKAELDAKTINGSNVIIEYKIKVTNVGEIDGYARKIADYMSNELKFSSELNKDWYQSGDTLYTTSIANDKIAAGESKVLTLTLTKSMTENSTGLIPNTAEIAESYNEMGINDSNSTPGNRVRGENDMGSAEVFLGIRTGGVVYISIVIVVAIGLGIVAFVIIRKRKQTEKI